MATRRTYSRAERLSAVFLARQASIAEAAVVLGIPPRNIERWSAGEVDLPADQWGAIEAVLLARVADQSARGNAKNLVALSTAAGIAGRNVRYSTLIARREARQQDDEPERVDPLANAIDALREDQVRLFRHELHAEIRRRQLAHEPEPAEGSLDESQLAALITTEYASLTPEQVAERMAVPIPELPPAEPRLVERPSHEFVAAKWVGASGPEDADHPAPRARETAGEPADAPGVWKPLAWLDWSQ